MCRQCRRCLTVAPDFIRRYTVDSIERGETQINEEKRKEITKTYPMSQSRVEALCASYYYWLNTSTQAQRSAFMYV